MKKNWSVRDTATLFYCTYPWENVLLNDISHLLSWRKLAYWFLIASLGRILINKGRGGLWNLKWKERARVRRLARENLKWVHKEGREDWADRIYLKDDPGGNHQGDRHLPWVSVYSVTLTGKWENWFPELSMSHKSQLLAYRCSIMAAEPETKGTA